MTEPEPSSDATPGNLADLLRAAAARSVAGPALITDDRSVSWAELDAAADAGAAVLMATGHPAGTRVLLALPTSIDLAVVLFAVARAGLVAVPVDPARPDLAVISGRVQAGIVIADVGDRAARALATVIPAADLAQWFDQGSPAPVRTTVGGEDLAVIARASHSDRAVMISHRAVLAAVAAIVATPGVELRSSDRVALVLPLYHLAGFVTAFLPLTASGGAAVIPGPSLTDLTAALRSHRVTILPGAPGLFHQLRAVAGVDRALGTVRLMTSGSAPLDPADFAGIRSLTGAPVWEGYGISESTSVVTSSLMTPIARPGSVGRPLTGIEVRIVEPDQPIDDPDVLATDRDIVADVTGAGEVGRIAVRGDTLFSGYWPDGDGRPDGDGWFVTGDVGYLDDLGELHLVDRAAETVTIAGFTVYPRELEEILIGHPYVAEAAVIGIPGPAGQSLIAVLAARPGTHPTNDDLAEFVADRVPVFKRPTRYHLVPALPRTELGRLDREAVLRQYADEVGVDLMAGRPTVLAAVPLAARPPDPAVTPVDPDPAVDPPDQPDAVGPEPELPARDVGPEAAAALGQLGARLPADHGGRRGARDTDEDLFGDEVL